MNYRKTYSSSEAAVNAAFGRGVKVGFARAKKACRRKYKSYSSYGKKKNKK